MPHLTLRLDDETLQKIERMREEMEKKHGIPVKRADMMRLLLSTGLQNLKDQGK